MKKVFTLSAQVLVWFVLMSAGLTVLSAQNTVVMMTEVQSTDPNAPTKIQFIGDKSVKSLSADHFVRKQADLKIPESSSIVREWSKTTSIQNASKNSSVIPSYFLGTAQSSGLGFQILKYSIDSQEDTIISIGYAGCPFSGYGAIAMGFYAYPSWAVWNGKEYIGYWVAQNSAGMEALGYFAYNPSVQEMKDLGDLEPENWQPLASTYDFSEEKIYIVQRAKVPSSDPPTYKMYLATSSGESTTFTRGSEITGMTESKFIVGLACNKDGVLYAINEDGNLYTINKSTGESTKIGATGIQTDYRYTQSMSMDHRTQKLYWQGVDAGLAQPTVVFYSVNISTGAATKTDDGFQIASLASMFHPFPSAESISDLNLNLNPANSLEIQMKFTIPSKDINGDLLVETNKPTKARIYKLENNAWVVKKEISTITVGQEISETFTETAEGTYYYAVDVLGADGKSSEKASAEITCMKIDLPYVNGFESSEIDAQKNVEVISPNTNVVLIDDADHAHGGTNSYLLANRGGSLNFKAIPVEKGAIYQVSFWFKSPVAGNNGAWVYLQVDGEQVIYKYAKAKNVYEKVSYIYEAEKDGQVVLSLLVDFAGDTAYVDDFKVEMVTSSKVPNVVEDLTIDAAENGEKNALLTFKTPELDQGGKELEDLKGVIIYYGTSYSFPFGNLVDTVKMTSLAKDTTVKISVPVSGNYYFGLITYNGYGESAYYLGGAATKTYIGYDKPKTPASIMVEAMPEEVSVEWDPVTEGVNGGYVDSEITYLLTYKCGDRWDSVKGLTETMHVFEGGLPMNHYQFSVRAINGDMSSDAKSTYRLVGLTDDQVVLAEPTAAGSTSTTYPLAMGTTSNAKQSAITQAIYQATDEPMYMDKLNLLTYATTDTIHQRYVVYMGYNDSNAFANTKDWISPNTLHKVFDGVLTSSTTTRVNTIPISGFYSDGQTPMVVQIIKPLRAETGNNWSTYTSLTPEDALFGTLYKSSNETDFEVLEDLSEHTSLNRDQYVPALFADKAKNLSTVSGAITNAIGEPLEAVIAIQSDETNEHTITAEINSDETGDYTFEFLPLGKINLNVQALGYLAIDTNIVVTAASSTITLNLEMQSTVAIAVSGVVKNEGGQALEGVVVTAKSIAEHTETTDAQGAYSFDLYGSTSYTFSYALEGTKEVSVDVVTRDEDTVLKDVVLEYIPYNVVWVDAKLNTQNQMEVSWHAPATLRQQAWSGTDSLASSLTNGGQAIRMAHRYTPADIETLKLKGQKIAKMGFMPTDQSAMYTIKICADTNTVLYSRNLEIHELNIARWNDFTIPGNIEFPEGKEIWFIVEVAEGYLAYPLGFGPSAAVANKGDLVGVGSTWLRVSSAASTIKGNALIRFAIEEKIQAHAPNGYAVYVGKKSDNFSAYTKLTTDNVKANTYTHSTYSALESGEYRYAVRGNYYKENWSDPAYSDAVSKDMFGKVNVTITANSGSAKDAKMIMIHKANPIYMYEASADADGKITFDKVFTGDYKVTATLPFHKEFTAEYAVAGTIAKTIALEEIVSKPYITSVEVSGSNANISFNANHPANWFDDVESYSDFAIDGIGEWIMANKTSKGSIDGKTWANAKEDQAFIVMNPKMTTPAITDPSWVPYSGAKYFSALFSTTKPNKDMLIRPVKSGGGILSFAVLGVGYDAPEQFRVMYSETDATPASFKVLPGTGVISAPTSWALASAQVPASAKFIAINCVSNDQFALNLDDISYMLTDLVDPIGFEIYLDGTKVADLEKDKSTYAFENLAVGEHVVGVKTKFKSGVSEMTTETITVAAFPAPVSLNVAVSEGLKEAIFTYEAPSGFTPLRYRIYLNDVLKDSVTATTYTFTNLASAAYQAGVVAVYADGVSEQAKVSFTTVDIKDLEAKESITVYPNPSKDGVFNVVLIEPSMIDVINAKGQVVLRQLSPVTGTYVLDLSNASKGLYYILIRTGQQDQTKVLKVISH